MSFQPNRTQYCVSNLVIRFKTKSESLRLQQQWETFERIENYDSVIYQRIQAGYLDKTYYVFRSSAEYNDYRAGQLLHIQTFPKLHASTFAPIRDRVYPLSPSTIVLTSRPVESNVSRCVKPTTPLTGAEYTMQLSDLEIYTKVSTFNQVHVLKYTFPSNEEKNAYERASRRLCAATRR